MSRTMALLVPVNQRWYTPWGWLPLRHHPFIITIKGINTRNTPCKYYTAQEQRGRHKKRLPVPPESRRLPPPSSMMQLAPRERGHLRYEKTAIRPASIRFTAFCLLALQRSGRAGIAKLQDAATSAHNNKPPTTNQDREASGTPYCRPRYP